MHDGDDSIPDVWDTESCFAGTGSSTAVDSGSVLGAAGLVLDKDAGAAGFDPGSMTLLLLVLVLVPVLVRALKVQGSSTIYLPSSRIAAQMMMDAAIGDECHTYLPLP